MRALVKLGLLGIVLSAVWLRVGGKIRGLDEKAMKMMVAGKLLGMVGKVFTSKAILGRAAGELRGVWV